ncbi:MAG: LysE family translocator [Chloroflexota bacterium]|jgi:threonine/homoserine/homoserine lactone efflux protein|nr:LysE family translocator [Chloroflexota bacterium]
MPTIPTLIAFAIAAIALVAIPGPNLIYIITRGIQQGRRAAVVSALGVEVGTLIHIVLATFGLSAIIASSPVLYDVVKYAGAGYLIWLGVSLIRRKAGSAEERIEVCPAGMRTIFLHGLAINLLNPKVILFVMALLPQFVDPSRGSTVGQMLVLGLVLVSVGTMGDMIYAFASGAVGSWLHRHPDADRQRDRASGVIYLALGVIVALTGSGSAERA